MKNISKLLLLCLLTSSSYSLMAQLSLGLRAGANFGNVSFDPDDDFDPMSITGLIIAVPFEIAISENFAVQPELMYIQKGYGEEDSFQGQTFSIDLIINQIDVPVLAKYLFVNSETFSAYAAGGPVFGYALSAKGKSESNGDKEEVDLDWDDDLPDYNRFEVLVSIGAGAGLPVGPGQIVLDLRYLFGLTDLDGADDDFTAKNNGFQATVGYMIPIGGE